MPKQFPIHNQTMEKCNVFSLGLPRKETKQQKKVRIRKEKERKLREDRRNSRKKHIFHPLPKQPQWLILSPYVCKGYEFWIQTLKGKTFIDKRNSLLASIAKIQTPGKPFFTFDAHISEQRQKEYIEKAQIVMSLLHLNQEIRWKFKVFFTKARILRFQKLNDTDPITMEPFQQPIYIHSFEQQKTYTFEASSMAKHIHKMLLQNDGHIPKASYPRNPLTNELFTLTQTMGLIDQCKKKGHSSWAMEAFLSSRYDLMSFEAIHSKPLRLNALRLTMANVDSWDSIDTLYDFIKSEHFHHKKVFVLNVYRWAVYHVPHERRIETWRKLCVKWYETDILVDDEAAKELFFDAISKKTLALCNPPHELEVLRKLRLKSQTTTESTEDGSSSSRDSESEG